MKSSITVNGSENGVSNPGRVRVVDSKGTRNTSRYVIHLDYYLCDLHGKF